MQKEMFSFITFVKNPNMKEITINSESMKPQQQTGKCIDQFQQHLYALQSYLHDASMMRLKIYEYLKNISGRMGNKQMSGSVVCIYLILRGILVWDGNCEGVGDREKFQGQMEVMKKEIQMRRKQFKGQILVIMGDIQRKANWSEFLLGFGKIWMLIAKQCYRQDLISWKLITFYQFLFVRPLQNDTTQLKQMINLASFRQFLQNQQRNILISPQIQTPSEIMRNPHQSNKRYTRKLAIATMKPNYGIKQLMIIQINNEAIDLVDRCKTYLCPFIIFLIPFNYLLAETFTYYTNFTSLQSFQIFSVICKRLKEIAKSSNPQLCPDQIEKHIAYQISVKGSSSQEYRSKLGQFLKKYKDKMQDFIPVFYQIFAFHAFEKYSFVDKVYKQYKSIDDRRKKIKQRLQLLYQQCKRDYFEDI